MAIIPVAVLSWVCRISLPKAYYRPRSFEKSRYVYRVIGVPLFARIAPKGNPALRLSAGKSSLGAFEQACHVASLGVSDKTVAKAVDWLRRMASATSDPIGPTLLR